MSTNTEQLDAAAVARPARPIRRILIAVASALVLLAALGAVAAVGYVGEINRGVTVLGVDIGGRSRGSAAALLRERLAGRFAAPVAVRVGATGASVDPSTVGLRLDVEATVARAARVSRGPFAWLFGSSAVSPEVEVDAERLHAALSPHVGDQAVPAVNPAVRFSGLTPTPVYPQPGKGLDRDRAAAALKEQWLRADTVEFPLVDVVPQTTREELDRIVTEVAVPAVSAPLVLSTPRGELRVPEAAIAAALRLEPDARGRVEPTLDAQALRTALGGALTAMETPSKDASITIENGQPVIKPHVDGQTVDLAASAADLLTALRRPAPRQATAQVVTAPPKTSAEQLAQLNIKERVSSFTTRFQAGQGRVVNIKRIADTVRGQVVKPGATFSLNGLVGERTRAKGYVDAPQIVSGKIKNGPGGGISQFTTTLFNASYYAGLVDVAHQPHTYYFDRYPAVIEATLDYPAIDLKFRNDSPAGIYIDTAYTDTSITVTLYGVKRYDIETVYGPRTNVVQPKEVRLREEDCNPTSGLPGFQQEAFRVFKQQGKEVKRERFFWRYDAEPKFVCESG